MKSRMTTYSLSCDFLNPRPNCCTKTIGDFVLVKIYKTGVAVVLIVINIVYAAITVGHAFFFHFIEISKAVTL